MIARNVELSRAALALGHVEAAGGDLGHAPGAADVALVLRDLGEDRQLLGLLEAAQTHGRRAGLRGDRHQGRMRPIGGRDPSHEVGDARAVLADTDAGAPADPRVAIGHVRGALLVDRGDEADTGRRKDVERVHVGGADDPEDLGDPVAGQSLDECLTGCHAGHLRPPFELIFCIPKRPPPGSRPGRCLIGPIVAPPRAVNRASCAAAIVPGQGQGR